MDEKNAFKIIWSEPAIGDLDALTEYIAADNPDAAERTGEAIFAKVRYLCSHSLMGRFVPELKRKDIRELIYAPYRIVYRAHKGRKMVEIVRVWHGARGTPEIYELLD